MLNFLASYPKSGNTWVRAFLDAYIQDKVPDINALQGTYSDANARLHYVAEGVDVTELPFEHQILTRPMALLRLAELIPYYDLQTDLQIPVILKTHFANGMSHTVRFIPPSLTQRVLYIVRNPLSVVVSYAKHNNYSIDKAINSLLDTGTVLFDTSMPADNAHKKVHQYVGNWAQHVWTYATATDIDVSVVRYEDLRTDPQRYFKWILEWFNIEVDSERLKRAVVNVQLNKLREQEEAAGFIEKPKQADRFFNSGLINGWQHILTNVQVKRIQNECAAMMSEFNYPTS